MKQVIPSAGAAGFAIGVLAVGATGVHARNWADEVTSAVLLIGLCVVTLAVVRRWLAQQDAETRAMVNQSTATAPRACCRAAERLEQATAALAAEEAKHAECREDYNDLRREHNVLIQQSMQSGYETFLPRGERRRTRPPDTAPAAVPAPRPPVPH